MMLVKEETGRPLDIGAIFWKEADGGYGEILSVLPAGGPDSVYERTIRLPFS